MKDKRIDKLLEQTYSEHPSDREINKMKEEIWMAVNEELRPKKKAKKWLKKLSIGLSAAAVLFIGFVIFSMNTEPGEVMMQSLRSLFVEGKKQIIEIEGQEEEIDTQLETNEELSYVIYIDESRYKLIAGEESDRIEMKEPVEGDFPEVYMEISREENTTTEEVIERIKQEIETDTAMGVRREERTTEPIEAEMIQGMGLDGSGDKESFGSEWNTPIHRYYVTDTINEQVFIIKQVYFLEAAEGHGARFHYMLESFEIVEE